MEEIHLERGIFSLRTRFNMAFSQEKLGNDHCRCKRSTDQKGDRIKCYNKMFKISYVTKHVH